MFRQPDDDDDEMDEEIKILDDSSTCDLSITNDPQTLNSLANFKGMETDDIDR